METKTSKAVSLLRAGYFKESLSIFRTFRIGFTKEEKRTIQIASECLSGNEPFYRSLGINTDEVITQSKTLLHRKYLVDSI